MNPEQLEHEVATLTAAVAALGRAMVVLSDNLTATTLELAGLGKDTADAIEDLRAEVAALGGWGNPRRR